MDAPEGGEEMPIQQGPPDDQVTEQQRPTVSSVFLEFSPDIEEESTAEKEKLYFQPPSCAKIMYRKSKQDRPKIVITYDRKEIRKKIDNLTYPQARRLMEEVYDPILEELYDAAEPCWAKHFAKLFAKEKELKEEEVIRHTLNDNRDLLGAIVDKIKLSDEAMADDKSKRFGYQHLYELMDFLEPYVSSFDWLVKDMYYIIAHMCLEAEDLETGAYEVICRIYLKYATFLDKMEKDIVTAEVWIEKAFKLARGELWVSGYGECDLTLHEYLAPIYGDILLRHARILMQDNFDSSFELTNQAVMILCEVGIDKFVKEFCQAHLVGGAILTENHYFDKALEFLNRIKEKIMEEDDNLKEMHTEFYYLQGVCFMNLDQNMQALEILDAALKNAKLFKQKRFEAMILLVQGQLIDKIFNDRCSAISTFHKAASLFKEVGDIENEKRTKYLFASLKADIIFPRFMDLVKTSKDSFCSTYILRQWKSLCVPFWIDMPEDFMTPVDPIYCLFKEDA